MRRIPILLLIAAGVGCEAEPQITHVPEPLATVTPGPNYEITIIRETLGGKVSRGNAINNRGWVAGFSFEPGDATLHAVLWRDGVLTDLGTLGGPSSRVPWPGLNNRGMVVGISQTAALDTLNEIWSCELGGFLPATNPRQVCSAFAWEDGVMVELPTLGGTHAFATGVNNRGQVVGWAETDMRDTTCDAPQQLQFLAVVWEPKKGTVQPLPPLPGHSSSAAVGINQRGQVVGISGECDQAVGRFSALASVLWDRGEPIPLPDLGGTTWHTPQDINDRGDVVGFSNPPGPGDPDGVFSARGFVWLAGSDTVIDVGTLDEDPVSQAQALNNRRQVVGLSFGNSLGPRAFLWHDGVLMDLNELVGAGFGPGEAYQLRSARDINDRGQITGDVLERSTGLILPFVATPAPPGRANR